MTKCKDCRFFDSLFSRRFDGQCLLELPPYLEGYIVNRGVNESNGCDLGKPKEDSEND